MTKKDYRQQVKSNDRYKNHKKTSKKNKELTNKNEYQKDFQSKAKETSDTHFKMNYEHTKQKTNNTKLHNTNVF